MPTARKDKDRPTYNKESGTRKRKDRTLGKTYKTTLRDKPTLYNRVRTPQPIVGRSRNTLNRTGHKGAGSHEHAIETSTFKQRWEPPNINQSSLPLFHRVPHRLYS